MQPLFGRFEESPEAYYQAYIKMDEGNEFKDLKRISRISKSIFDQVDHDKIRKKRKENFNFLFDRLQSENKLDLKEANDFTPMCFPYLIPKGFDLKKKLIQSRIFIPSYWPNKKITQVKGSFEAELNKNLLSLPIDQRYDLNDMKRIIELIRRFGK